MKPNTCKIFSKQRKKTNLKYYSINYLFSSLTLSLLITIGLPVKISALPQFSTNSVENKYQVFFRPPERNSPKATTGGASRSIGKCIQQAENQSLPFSPLIPQQNRILTASSHPTLLVYLPETSAKEIFITWKNEQGNEHYQTILPIENQAGIISLTLPTEVPSLEIGKKYHWALALMCNNELKPDSPTIQGDIERVEIDSQLRNSLQNASSIETAAIYAQAGIWYDTVATLASIQIEKPYDKNLTSNWKQLLTDVGLEEVAEIPLNELD